MGSITVYNRSSYGIRLEGAVVEALDAAGSVVWSDTISGAANGSVHQYTVALTTDSAAPIANLADPIGGGSVTQGTLNGQDYIDVTFTDTGGSGLDAATIDGDELTLSGSGVGTAVLTGTATLVSENTYRYPFTGDFGVGSVNVSFIAGSWQDHAGNVNLAESESFSVQPDSAANLITTVRVRLTDTDYLQLNEVVVLEQGTGTNLALAGVASQSSTYSTVYPAEKAIDGQTSSGTPSSIAITQATRCLVGSGPRRCFRCGQHHGLQSLQLRNSSGRGGGRGLGRRRRPGLVDTLAVRQRSVISTLSR